MLLSAPTASLFNKFPLSPTWGKACSAWEARSIYQGPSPPFLPLSGRWLPLPLGPKSWCSFPCRHQVFWIVGLFRTGWNLSFTLRLGCLKFTEEGFHSSHFWALNPNCGIPKTRANSAQRCFFPSGTNGNGDARQCEFQKLNYNKVTKIWHWKQHAPPLGRGWRGRFLKGKACGQMGEAGRWIYNFLFALSPSIILAYILGILWPEARITERLYVAVVNSNVIYNGN